MRSQRGAQSSGSIKIYVLGKDSLSSSRRSKTEIPKNMFRKNILSNVLHYSNSKLKLFNLLNPDTPLQKLILYSELMLWALIVRRAKILWNSIMFVLKSSLYLNMVISKFVIVLRWLAKTKVNPSRIWLVALTRLVFTFNSQM